MILSTFHDAGGGGIGVGKDTLKTLKRIYDEVKEMGPYPGQSFTQQEFFAGGPDDDDTNKDQHVVVLIQNVSGKEKMTIQVTYLERTKHDPTIKYAKDVKNISCILSADKIQVQSTDYGEKEMDKLVPDILRAIVNKKKLLKEKLGD